MNPDIRAISEDVQRESRSHTVSLPELVARVLAAGGVGIEDVEGIAVSIGPGSFTGLRIGLGLAKGLAYAGGLPLVAVPTLDALAWVADARPGETICAALDARLLVPGPTPQHAAQLDEDRNRRNQKDQREYVDAAHHTLAFVPVSPTALM